MLVSTKEQLDFWPIKSLKVLHVFFFSWDGNSINMRILLFCCFTYFVWRNISFYSLDDRECKLTAIGFSRVGRVTEGKYFLYWDPRKSSPFLEVLQTFNDSEKSRLHTSISKNFPPVTKDFSCISLITSDAHFLLTSQICVTPDGKRRGHVVREPYYCAVIILSNAVVTENIQTRTEGSKISIIKLQNTDATSPIPSLDTVWS